MKRIIIRYITGPKLSKIGPRYFAWSGPTFRCRFFASMDPTIESLRDSLEIEFPGRIIVLLPE